MKKNSISKNVVVIYQAKSGAIELRGDFSKETMWATQAQIADLFDTDKSGISRHISNIFATRELEEKRTVANFATVQKEGKRRIERQVEYYNLDVILSVGYRVNSKKATLFRQWATNTLKQYIAQGYVVHKSRILEHYEQFLGSVENIKALLPPEDRVDAKSALELVSAFADTWLSLDAYDKESLPITGTTKKSVNITAVQLLIETTHFKSQLMSRGEATDIFATERSQGNVEGIVGNVMQSFGGTPVYPTVEEKAAHLLYFMIKNHPFVDGNKRIGAYAFVWFLQKAGLLRRSQITPPALTALTLFIAESDPKNKDRMVRLILQLLKK